MHLLRTYARPTSSPERFQVFWTNSPIRLGGLINVQITHPIEDRQIAAELAVMQHLLEIRGVLGQQLVGNANSRLIASQGAIRKLQRRQSDKAHLAPYANFLTTRYAGCPVSIDKDTSWFEGCEPVCVETLQLNGPRRMSVNVHGIGEVAVTQHVLDRINSRLIHEEDPARAAQLAWHKLSELAADRSIREVRRQSLWAGLKHEQDGQREGRYFLNGRRNLVLVVTDNPREGKRLVTTYPATHHFRAMPTTV